MSIKKKTVVSVALCTCVSKVCVWAAGVALTLAVVALGPLVGDFPGLGLLGLGFLSGVGLCSCASFWQ